MEFNEFSGICVGDRVENVGAQDIGAEDLNIFHISDSVKHKVSHLSEETDEFLITTYGKYLAFGFRGDKSFVTRCENWCENMGLTNSHSGGKVEFHRKDYETFSLGYVLTKNRDAIFAALKEQFVMEIVADGEVEPISEGWVESEESETAEYVIKYDDAAIEAMASVRSERFLNERIKPECFMGHYDEAIDDSVYSVSSFSHGGKWESIKSSERAFVAAKTNDKNTPTESSS